MHLVSATSPTCSTYFVKARQGTRAGVSLHGHLLRRGLHSKSGACAHRASSIVHVCVGGVAAKCGAHWPQSSLAVMRHQATSSTALHRAHRQKWRARKCCNARSSRHSGTLLSTVICNSDISKLFSSMRPCMKSMACMRSAHALYAGFFFVSPQLIGYAHVLPPCRSRAGSSR